LRGISVRGGSSHRAAARSRPNRAEFLCPGTSDPAPGGDWPERGAKEYFKTEIRQAQLKFTELQWKLQDEMENWWA